MAALMPGARPRPHDRIAVERGLAERLDLEVGDTVRLGAAPDSLSRLAVVSAIYEPRPDPAEISRQASRVRMHLPDLAALLGAPDRVDRFGIGLRPGVSADSAAAVLNRYAFGFRAHPSAAIASESSQTFRVVSRFHRAIAVITIVASAVFLLCIMLLKVEERRMDAAVMRFVGVRRRTIFGALVLEAALVAVLGSVARRRARLAGRRRHQRLLPALLRHRAHLLASSRRASCCSASASRSLLGLAAGAVAAWRLVRTPPMVLWGRA